MVCSLGRRRWSAISASCLVVGWCGWASSFARGTWQAWATWLASLAMVVLVDVAASRRRAPLDVATVPRTDPRGSAPAVEAWPGPGAGTSRLLRGLAPWIALGVVATAWDVLGLDTGPHEPHLTLSALSQAYRPVHAATLLAWMALGAGFAIVRERGPHSPGGRSSHGGLATVSALGWSSARHAAVLALLEPSSRPVGIGFWAGVALAAVVLDRYGRRSSGRVPGAWQLLRLGSSSRTATSLIVAAWVVAGWHLFAH